MPRFHFRPAPTHTCVAAMTVKELLLINCLLIRAALFLRMHVVEDAFKANNLRNSNNLTKVKSASTS